jgi:hypothetical protein
MFLSPSKLTFLYNECQRCFYLDAHKIFTRPYSAFPSVFTEMDKLMRAHYHERTDVLLDRPGYLSTKALRKKSQPINLFGFSGEVDCLAFFDDGTIGIFDYKVSSSASHSLMYCRQLGAYRYIFENPLSGTSAKVSELALVYAAPVNFDGANFQFEITKQVLDYSRDEFIHFALEVENLLELPLEEVPYDPKCPHCRMQKALQVIPDA